MPTRPATPSAPTPPWERRGRLAWGGDWNPEQWPAEVAERDVELMLEAGVTMATVAVFAWARLEPRPGEFTFGWLDRVLDLLEDAGIGIDLATATASPPAWMHQRHPEVLPVTADGTTLGFGARQAWCPSSPVVREHQVRLATAMAQRYGGRAGLELWHVGNEYGCHVAACHCDVSTSAFRRWLEERYGHVGALNEAWGTGFWSQRYDAFEQVGTPAAAPSFLNPTQQLDFRRFCSDELLACYRGELEVLRRTTPLVPVTTNFMVGWTFDDVDYADWVDHVDVVTNDHYLRADDPAAHVELAFSADRVRGLAAGGHWLLLEHSTSAVNWQPVNVAKRPGELARNALSHVARGSQGAMFFQFRQSRAGAERFHSAMVPHAGTDTRVFREVVTTGRHMARLAPVLASTTEPARVVLLTDAEADWALGREALPVAGLRHHELSLHLYRRLHARNVAVDVVPLGQPLGARDVVVAPALPLLDDADAAQLADAVRGGARLVVTFATGLSDRDDHVHLGGHPGPASLRELLGVRVDEHTPPPPGTTIDLGAHGTGSRWFEDVATTDAEVVAAALDGPRPGGPAVTRAPRGDGAAWYVATWLDDIGWDALLDVVLEGVDPVADADPGVEAVRRVDGDDRFLFLLNHTEREARARTTGVEMLAGRAVGPDLVLPPGGVAVVRERPAGATPT